MRTRERAQLTPAGGDWCVTEGRFRAGRAGHYESLFTLANGYHGMRGSLEFAPQYGIQGSYFAGVCDQAPVYFEELVNGPNWADLEIRTGGEKLDPGGSELLAYRRTLDLRQGVLFTFVRWRDSGRRVTRYESARLVHLVHKRRALLWGRVTAENWSGELTLAGGINAGGENTTQPAAVKVRHLGEGRLALDRRGVIFQGATLRTGLPVVMRTNLVVSGRAPARAERGRDLLRQVGRVRVERGRPVGFAKHVAFSGLPLGLGSPGAACARELAGSLREGVAGALRSHVAAWAKRWAEADVRIEGDRASQVAVRFNLFHLMQLGNDLPELDVSIGARGLHGEGYRGHVFWDTETFMLPFFTATRPEVARALLMYRYRRLAAARRLAREIGCRGARFPWQSCLNGGEVTPPRYLTADVLSGKDCDVAAEPDNQLHVTADVALAVDRYVAMSGDEDFYLRYGARMLVETARFWASRAERDGRRRAYVIRGVRCPDEYHEPVDNNAFTNYCAAENLRLGLRAAADLRRRRPGAWRRLCAEIGLQPSELRAWERIQAGIFLPLDPRTGLIEEFDGYFRLRDVRVRFDGQGWPVVPARHRRTPESQTQLVKQADVVLLLYLFGDRFSGKVKLTNFKYYEARTTHGSSLSPNTYALVGIEVGEQERAFRAFRASAFRDLRFTRESHRGIHAACLGGTWQAAVNGFGGLRASGDVLCFRPWLPPRWKRLAFTVLWRGSRLAVQVGRRRFHARVQDGPGLSIRVNGIEHQVTPRGIAVPLRPGKNR